MMEQQQNPGSDPGDLISGYLQDEQDKALETARHSVLKARNALCLAGGLMFISQMAFIQQPAVWPYRYYLLVALGEGLVFVALGLWTRSKPYTAVVTGVLLLVVHSLLRAALMGYTQGAGAALNAFTSDLIFKLLILFVLNRAVKGARMVQNASKQKI